MPPEGYRGFWDQLMWEQGVMYDTVPETVMVEVAPNFNVGHVIVGEIVEE